jgi:hypothetical protein
MKTLRILILTLCTFFFATSAFAEEIVMICTFYNKDSYEGKSQTRYLKYSNPLIGRKQIYQRIEGKWEKWCRPNELAVSNKGAVMTTYVSGTLSKRFEGFPKGFEYVKVDKYTIDFEFLKRRIDIQFKSLHTGEVVFGKKGDAWERWDCSRHIDPHEKPSIKGRIEGVIK